MREPLCRSSVDSAHLAGLVRAGIDTSNGSVEECLGEGSAAQVAAIRTGIATGLRSLLVARIRSLDPGTRITVHGSGDPWATGSFSTVHPALGDDIDGVGASCWDPAAGLDRIRELRALASAGTAIGAYVRLDRGWPPGDVTNRRLLDYLDAGMSELHLYHLGLLGRAGLENLGGVADTTRTLSRQASPT